MRRSTRADSSRSSSCPGGPSASFANWGSRPRRLPTRNTIRGAGMTVEIRFDPEKCAGCNQCVELCPEEVLAPAAEQGVPGVSRADDCCICMTCAGKCPRGAILITQRAPAKRYIDDENTRRFEGPSEAELETYVGYSETLERV